jgi:acetoin utilization deacetylase AcuC-like enzyme
MDGYRKIGRLVRTMADEHSKGRLLIVQEGGYHITYSAYCLHATIEGVLKVSEPLIEDPIAGYPEDSGLACGVVSAIKRHWIETIPFLKEIWKL